MRVLPERVALSDRYFAAPANEGVLEYLDGSHGFVHTATARILLEALKNAGTLPNSLFLWLRGVDRGLWYALSNVRRKSCFVEGIAAKVHFQDELSGGTAIEPPSVDRAILGIRPYLSRPDAEASHPRVNPA